MFGTDKLNCDLPQGTRRRTKVRREVKFVRNSLASLQKSVMRISTENLFCKAKQPIDYILSPTNDPGIFNIPYNQMPTGFAVCRASLYSGTSSSPRYGTTAESTLFAYASVPIGV